MTTVQVAIPWRDQGDEHRRAAWDWMRASWAKRHPEWEVVTGDCEGEFSIPAALNATIAKTTADVLIVTGADAQLGADALRRAVVAAETYPWVMAADSMVRLGADLTGKVLKMPVGQTLPNNGGRRFLQLGWGVLVGRREVFERINHDERLWCAWEDSAWGYAASTLIGEPHIQERVAVRLLWHPRVRRHKQPCYDESTARMGLYKAAHIVKDAERLELLLAEGRSRG